MEVVQKFASIRHYTPTQDTLLYLDSDQNLVHIQLILDSKLDMSCFKQVQKQVHEECTHIIFIYLSTTLYAKNLRNYQNVLQVEMFEYYELKRLLTGNIFTPTYRILSPEETHDVLTRYPKEQLPSILMTDPIIKLHDCRVGQIVEVNRRSSLIYRVVVPA